MTSRPNLRESDKARLRDWYDTSGTWVVKMSALYDLVGEITDTKAAEIVHEQAGDTV